MYCYPSAPKNTSTSSLKNLTKEPQHGMKDVGTSYVRLPYPEGKCPRRPSPEDRAYTKNSKGKCFGSGLAERLSMRGGNIDYRRHLHNLMNTGFQRSRSASQRPFVEDRKPMIADHGLLKNIQEDAHLSSVSL